MESYGSLFTAAIRHLHYENTPIQIYWKFYHQKKNENFQIKISDIFYISAQNIARRF